MSTRRRIGHSAPAQQLLLREPEIWDASLRGEDASIEVINVNGTIFASNEQERMRRRGFDAAAKEAFVMSEQR